MLKLSIENLHGYCILILKERRVTMRTSHLLKDEICARATGAYLPNYFRTVGYENTKSTSDPQKRADAIATLFTLPEPHIYKNDLIAGSIRPLVREADEETKQKITRTMEDYPERYFSTNSDHFTPDYHTAVELGVPGLLAKIGESKKAHAAEPDKVDFLEAMETTLLAFRQRLLKNAAKCRELTGTEGYDDTRLEFRAENLEAIADNAPNSFAEGLQLVWMLHSSFLFEGRFAMALGRIDP